MQIPRTARALSIVTLLAGVLAYPACAQTLDELKNDGKNTDMDALVAHSDHRSGRRLRPRKLLVRA